MLNNIIMMFGDWIIRVYCAGGYIAVFAAMVGIVAAGVMFYSGVETIFRKVWRKRSFMETVNQDLMDLVEE